MKRFDRLELETPIETDMNHLRTAFPNRIALELTDAETSEIFVSGPAVEGVHLRFGPVFRGGFRWSVDAPPQPLNGVIRVSVRDRVELLENRSALVHEG
jgi:hypothetical protein